jgi:hypothetical protein
MIAKDVVLAYPDYSEVLDIYTNASSKQLGAVITQKNRPIVFFSPKLIMRKPTSVKNPQVNAILERIHPVVLNMLHTAEIDMADSLKPSDIDIFLSDAAWAICFTHHRVLKASPGTTKFGQDMLFNILFIADWKKIGEHGQLLTNHNTNRDYDYQVGQKVLIRNEGILCKAESRYQREPLTITSVLSSHMNRTIRVQCGNKSERMNIRRVKPFEKKQVEI